LIVNVASVLALSDGGLHHLGMVMAATGVAMTGRIGSKVMAMSLSRVSRRAFGFQLPTALCSTQVR
jgi:hypothetical protein